MKSFQQSPEWPGLSLHDGIRAWWVDQQEIVHTEKRRLKVRSSDGLTRARDFGK